MKFFNFQKSKAVNFNSTLGAKPFWCPHSPLNSAQFNKHRATLFSKMYNFILVILNLRLNSRSLQFFFLSVALMLRCRNVLALPLENSFLRGYLNNFFPLSILCDQLLQFVVFILIELYLSSLCLVLSCFRTGKGEVDCPHRGLTSTASNIFGMKWNTAHHQWPTSMLLVARWVLPGKPSQHIQAAY